MLCADPPRVGLTSFLDILKCVNTHFWSCMYDLSSPWSKLWVRILGGLCKQDLLEKWEALRLAVLIYQPQWFTVIDIHIPECQNRLCLKRNQWLRLWFYLRPFPDKRLNRAWSCENTMREHHCPASVCAQGLGKGHRHWGWPPWSHCTGLCTEHLRSPLQCWEASRPVLVSLHGISAQP